MAKRMLILLLLVGVVGGGVYLWMNWQITEIQYGDDGWVQSLVIARRADQPAVPGSSQPAPRVVRPAIRIATFNLGRLDEKKLANLRVSNVLVRLLPKFDIVAAQDIRSRNQEVLLRLIDQINATEREYDYAICPGVQHDGRQQYSAFLFDRASVEIDRSTVQSVEDPERRFHHQPLVALFRVKGPDQAEAFTFKLINVHTDPDRAAVEFDLLDDVYRAVRGDGAGRDGASEDVAGKYGAGEDDIILLGDFAVGGDHLAEVAKIPEITSSITDTPTTMRSAATVDNILFDRRATTEFTGRADVLDLMREFDLTSAAAAEVSDHFPVWAEFSSYEGGESGHVAGRTAPIAR